MYKYNFMCNNRYDLTYGTKFIRRFATYFFNRSPAGERSPTGNFIADHVIIGRLGLSVKDENRPKGMKM